MHPALGYRGGGAAACEDRGHEAGCQEGGIRGGHEGHSGRARGESCGQARQGAEPLFVVLDPPGGYFGQSLPRRADDEDLVHGAGQAVDDVPEHGSPAPGEPRLVPAHPR